jgi:hypothetical protein
MGTNPFRWWSLQLLWCVGSKHCDSPFNLWDFCLVISVLILHFGTSSNFEDRIPNVLAAVFAALSLLQNATIASELIEVSHNSINLGLSDDHGQNS